MSKYPRLRNRKPNFRLPHSVIEDKKEVWILCESSITAIGIGAMVKTHYPDYKPCLCNRKTFLEMGGKL